MSKIDFEIKKELGCLKEYPTGWRKLVQVISWNGGKPKIDIREWDPNKQYMTRGITLTFEEFEKLKSINV